MKNGECITKTVVVILMGVLLVAIIMPGTRNKERNSIMVEREIPVDDVVKGVQDGSYEKAMFGAGCFWGVELTFRQIDGVVDAAVGYSGGTVEEPTYREVCSDGTGHAEVVEVVYDPHKVSYDKLLEVFWGNHNPTTLNRQGPDVGSQYRSAIFYYSQEQEAAAKASKDQLAESGKFGEREIVTEIAPAGVFWRGEEYHQRYLEKKGIKSCGPKH